MFYFKGKPSLDLSSKDLKVSLAAVVILHRKYVVFSSSWHSLFVPAGQRTESRVKNSIHLLPSRCFSACIVTSDRSVAVNLSVKCC